VSTPQAPVIYRPQPPPNPKGPSGWGLEHIDGMYLVMQKGDLVAVYNSVYFRSTNEVVRDLLDLIASGQEGPWGEDYVIWCGSRVMAVIHQLMDEPRQQVVLFNDPRNDPIDSRALEPWPCWPTYDQWVESGRGDLWTTDRCDWAPATGEGT
jgi:hypothetical protein